MAYEETPKTETEPDPERVLSHEEVLSQLRSRCEGLEIERELSNAEGVYLLEMLSPDRKERYTYQRKGSFGKIQSGETTVRKEDVDGSYSTTIADYDPITGKWTDQ